MKKKINNELYHPYILGNESQLPKFSLGNRNKCEDDDCDCGDEQMMANYSLRDRMWGAYLQEKKIILNTPINDSLVERAIMQIFTFNEHDARMQHENPSYKADPIRIYINSGGGNFDETFSLISAIEASTTPVITIALGKAYSAGFLILLAGHARFSQRYSTLLLHQGSAGIGGEFSKVIEYAEHWKKCQGIVDDYIIRKTKIKRKQLTQIFNNRQDFYLDTQMALDLGCIDGIWQY